MNTNAWELIVFMMIQMPNGMLILDETNFAPIDNKAECVYQKDRVGLSVSRGKMTGFYDHIGGVQVEYKAECVEIVLD